MTRIPTQIQTQALPGQRQPPALEPIRIVCGTRASREEFLSETALGQSLVRLMPPAVELRLFPRNSSGLSLIYNTAIEEARGRPAILLFIHDDVYLNDVFWADRLREGVSYFDVIGVAGDRQRIARQPSWCFTRAGTATDEWVHDHTEGLSGAVAHGGPMPERVDVFGPSEQSVKLLDGLFLAARSGTLLAKSARFDERFEFHMYDMDFCRQAERAGLTLGTWPISVIHESRGRFGSEAWRQAYQRYLEKWGE